jgi:hypothetical protein
MPFRRCWAFSERLGGRFTRRVGVTDQPAQIACGDPRMTRFGLCQSFTLLARDVLDLRARTTGRKEAVAKIVEKAQSIDGFREKKTRGLEDGRNLVGQRDTVIAGR